MLVFTVAGHNESTFIGDPKKLTGSGLIKKKKKKKTRFPGLPFPLSLFAGLLSLLAFFGLFEFKLRENTTSWKSFRFDVIKTETS
jgi:hypothetical protein